MDLTLIITSVVSIATALGAKELLSFYQKRKAEKEDKDSNRLVKLEEREEKDIDAVRALLEQQNAELKAALERVSEEARQREAKYEEIIESLRVEVEKLKALENELVLKVNSLMSALHIALDMIQKIDPDDAALIESISRIKNEGGKG